MRKPREAGAGRLKCESPVTSVHKPVTSPVQRLLRARTCVKSLIDRQSHIEPRIAKAMNLDRRTLVTGSLGLVAATALRPLPAAADLTGFRPKGGSGVDHS